MTLYFFLLKIMRVYFKLMGWKVQGLKNFPADGPVILAINHQSAWDPIVMAAAVPRHISYMGKEELFSVPLLGRLITIFGAFPVKRGQGDMSAIRQSLAILKEGRVLGVFPEGSRSKTGEIQKGLPGMVLLMERGQAAVVPVKIFGTRKLMTGGRGKIAVVIGKPLNAQMLKAPEGVENRREWIADRIMEEMSGLSVMK